MGALLGTGTAADLATDHRMAQAALGGVVVWWHVGMSHEDEKFLDVALDAPAQLALGCRGVVEEGLADAQQPPFQVQLGGAPSRWLLVMGNSRGVAVDVLDCASPLVLQRRFARKGTLKTSSWLPAHALDSFGPCLPRSDFRPMPDQIEEPSL